MDMYNIFCMFVDRLYQTSTKQFLFDHLKAILHISELDLFWVSFRGLPVDCLISCKTGSRVVSANDRARSAGRQPGSRF